jgi:hypothetical protein
MNDLVSIADTEPLFFAIGDSLESSTMDDDLVVFGITQAFILIKQRYRQVQLLI